MKNVVEKIDYLNLNEKVSETIKLNKELEEIHRYYLTQRPPSIGTHPKGALNIISFDTKQNYEGINCYGYVDYQKQLNEKDIETYELIEKKSHIYNIRGKDVNLENVNLKEIEYFKTNKNISLEDGSRIRKDTYFLIEGGTDDRYEVRFEINNKNKYINDTNEYLFSKNEILDFAEPDVITLNKIKVIDDEEAMLKVKDYAHMESMERELIEEIEIKKPLIDMTVNKDIDVSEILENLKNGVENIFTNEKFIEYLEFQSKFHNYSANNSILIALQNPEATNVASFAKWQSLGRSVNKGQKGIVILAPNVSKLSNNQIFDKLDKDGAVKIEKYYITQKNNTFNISVNGQTIKANLPKKELENFININKLKAQIIVGFRKAYVFDISQTSGKEIPQFKLQKLSDKELLDINGFYKNPLIKVHMSEDNILQKEKLYTFKQANSILSKAEIETRNLKKEYEAKGEYYPYLKQRFDIITKPNLVSIPNDRFYIGDGTYNNLLEFVKGELKNYDPLYTTLEQTLKSNDSSMEIIVGIKNQIENLINNKGIVLDYSTETGTASGFFAPNENKICVNGKMSLTQTTKTLLHEYVHSQLHKEGYSKDIAKDDLDVRQTAEIEAEATTYVVSKYYGFDTSEYSFDYVSSWSMGKEVSTLENTLRTIKSTAEKIINDIKSPLELDIYNNKETILEILKSENITPNEKIINSMIEINSTTGKVNNISDLSNAEKFKSYSSNKELSSKISDINKELKANEVIVEKTVKVEIER